MKRILWTFLALAAAFLFSLLPTTSYATEGTCIPGIYGPEYPGAVRQPLTRFNAGWAAWGWCKSATPSAPPEMILRMCSHGECPSSMGEFVGGILYTLGLAMLGSDPVTVYGSYLKAHPADWTCSTATAGTPHGDLCAEVGAIQAAQLATFYTPVVPPPPPPPPPTYTWFIKLNASFTGTPNTSPVYSLANGVRGAATGARVEFDTPCKPEVASAPSGTSTTQQYAAFAPLFDPTRVGLCVKHATTP